ncbi:MAG: carboxypeptidase regulatory-like domain-containing protein [Acidobacteria bacterium]|nr:carboxypeptidase regulatory-like domain-containing protein [Acidobacteriota bacterium]
MRRRKPAISLGVAALALSSALSVSAATSVRLTGSLGGQVRSAAGVVQMGATVVLYNRYDRAIRSAITNPDGSFGFDSLLPDVYSLRVSLSSFLPAFRRNIAVQPGFHSVLTISLSSMLSSIEFVSSAPATGSLMSEDWKWVLRSSQATRPVMRLVDLKDPPAGRPRMSNVFSETRGMVKLSAGDGASLGVGSQPDLGTAFAVATSVFGSNQLELSGNFGYSSHTGLPAAGFRTKFSRNGGSQTPEITVSMRQVYLPSRGGFGVAVPDGPSMRVMSATLLHELEAGDRLRLEYGSSVESVSLLNRLNVLSPFARLTFDMGSNGRLKIAYSSGALATELAARGNDAVNREDASLNQELNTLGMMPILSIRNNQARAQRTENVEIGYTKVAGSRTYSAGIYHERVSDGAAMLAGSGDLFASDVLPDLGSESSIFNLGKFSRWGYTASMTQAVGQRMEISAAYGRGGALTTEGRELSSEDADELRRFIRMHEKNWVTVRASGTVPVTGTRVGASYGWTDRNSMMPVHLYLAQRLNVEPGLNISIRQPLPGMGGMPGRLEATAEFRNLLQQGYLPLTAAGRSMLFTNSPRAVRGGLSFIF